MRRSCLSTNNCTYFVSWQANRPSVNDTFESGLWGKRNRPNALPVVGGEQSGKSLRSENFKFQLQDVALFTETNECCQIIGRHVGQFLGFEFVHATAIHATIS